MKNVAGVAAGRGYVTPAAYGAAAGRGRGGRGRGRGRGLPHAAAAPGASSYAQQSNAAISLPSLYPEVHLQSDVGASIAYVNSALSGSAPAPAALNLQALANGSSGGFGAAVASAHSAVHAAAEGVLVSLETELDAHLQGTAATDGSSSSAGAGGAGPDAAAALQKLIDGTGLTVALRPVAVESAAPRPAMDSGSASAIYGADSTLPGSAVAAWRSAAAVGAPRPCFDWLAAALRHGGGSEAWSSIASAVQQPQPSHVPLATLAAGGQHPPSHGTSCGAVTVPLLASAAAAALRASRSSAGVGSATAAAALASEAPCRDSASSATAVEYAALPAAAPIVRLFNALQLERLAFRNLAAAVQQHSVQQQQQQATRAAASDSHSQPRPVLDTSPGAVLRFMRARGLTCDMLAAALGCHVFVLTKYVAEASEEDRAAADAAGDAAAAGEEPWVNDLLAAPFGTALPKPQRRRRGRGRSSIAAAGSAAAEVAARDRMALDDATGSSGSSSSAGGAGRPKPTAGAAAHDHDDEPARDVLSDPETDYSDDDGDGDKEADAADVAAGAGAQSATSAGSAAVVVVSDPSQLAAQERRLRRTEDVLMRSRFGPLLTAAHELMQQVQAAMALAGRQSMEAFPLATSQYHDAIGAAAGEAVLGRQPLSMVTVPIRTLRRHVALSIALKDVMATAARAGKTTVDLRVQAGRVADWHTQTASRRGMLSALRAMMLEEAALQVAAIAERRKQDALAGAAGTGARAGAGTGGESTSNALSDVLPVGFDSWGQPLALDSDSTAASSASAAVAGGAPPKRLALLVSTKPSSEVCAAPFDLDAAVRGSRSAEPSSAAEMIEPAILASAEVDDKAATVLRIFFTHALAATDNLAANFRQAANLPAHNLGLLTRSPLLAAAPASGGSGAPPSHEAQALPVGAMEAERWLRPDGGARAVAAAKAGAGFAGKTGVPTGSPGSGTIAATQLLDLPVAVAGDTAKVAGVAAVVTDVLLSLPVASIAASDSKRMRWAFDEGETIARQADGSFTVPEELEDSGALSSVGIRTAAGAISLRGWTTSQLTRLLELRMRLAVPPAAADTLLGHTRSANAAASAILSGDDMENIEAQPSFDERLPPGCAAQRSAAVFAPLPHHPLPVRGGRSGQAVEVPLTAGPVGARSAPGSAELAVSPSASRLAFVAPIKVEPAAGSAAGAATVAGAASAPQIKCVLVPPAPPSIAGHAASAAAGALHADSEKSVSASAAPSASTATALMRGGLLLHSLALAELRGVVRHVITSSSAETALQTLGGLRADPSPSGSPASSVPLHKRVIWSLDLLSRLVVQAPGALDRLVALTLRLLQAVAHLLQAQRRGAAPTLIADSESSSSSSGRASGGPQAPSSLDAAVDAAAAELWLPALLSCLEDVALTWAEWMPLLQACSRVLANEVALQAAAVITAQAAMRIDGKMVAAAAAVLPLLHDGLPQLPPGALQRAAEESSSDASMLTMAAATQAGQHAVNQAAHQARMVQQQAGVSQLETVLSQLGNNFLIPFVNGAQSRMQTLQASLWTLLRPIFAVQAAGAAAASTAVVVSKGKASPTAAPTIAAPWWEPRPVVGGGSSDTLHAAVDAQLRAVLLQFSLVLRQAPCPLRLWCEPSLPVAAHE